MRVFQQAAAWLAGAVVVVVVALAVSYVWSQPPAAKPVDAPSGEFAAERALAHAVTILGDETPHPVGTEEHRAVADRIAGQLGDWGYAVEVQETFACSELWALCSDVRNVMARWPGSGGGEDERAILLTAHYDSVPAGPGAADDMAGVAILLEIASMLRNEAPAGNPVIFLFSDAEEPGLVGAQAFVTEHPWATEIGAVVNLEARGTEGLSLLFETSENNAWLIDAYADNAPRPVASSLFYELYKVAPNNTDFTVYKRAGLPGVNFGFTDGGTRYHTPLDNLAYLDPGSVQHQGDNTLAMVRALANRDLTSQPTGNLVYIDLIPGAVLRWPASWTIGMVIACLLIWIGILVRCHARKVVSARQIGWGMVLLPVSIVCALLLGFGVTFALVELTGLNVPWYAEPWPSRLAIWAAAIAGMVAGGVLLARRAGVYGTTLGVWLWWVVLSCLVALFLPGASVMFLAPTSAGLLAMAVSVFLPGRSDTRALVATLIGLAIVSWFWLPIALVVETIDLHQATGAVAAAMVALGLTPGLPLLALLPEKRRSLSIGVGVPVAITVAATAWAVVTPAYSAPSPQRLNVLQVEDRAGGAAYLAMGGDVVSAGGGASVPVEMLAAAEFADRPTAMLPWSTDRLLTAPAVLATEATPLATVLEDTPREDGRRMRLRLGLAPGATRITLYFPAETPVTGITLVESGQTVMPSAADNGYRSFSCLGLSCEGREIDVAFESDGPVSFLVAEFSPEMPEAAQALMASRPAVAQPSHDGDHYIRIERIESSVDGS